MSHKNQVLSATLHGEALLTAGRPELQPLIDHLREVAQGRDDIRTECAGIIAGWVFAGSARRGEDLIAAGPLLLAGRVDLDELDRWVRIGCTTPGMESQCRDAILAARALLLVLGGVLTDLYGAMAADDVAPNALIVVTGYPYLLSRTRAIPASQRLMKRQLPLTKP